MAQLARAQGCEPWEVGANPTYLTMLRIFETTCGLCKGRIRKEQCDVDPHAFYTFVLTDDTVNVNCHWCGRKRS